jgi:peptidase E
MPKEIIFLGGGDYRKEENIEIDDYLISVLNKDSKILIIPFAAPKEKYVSWASALLNNFKKYGISNFEILDEDLSEDIMVKRIKGSNALFFTGGSPELLLDKLKEKNLINFLLNYPGILIGYSAGTLVFCKECIILPEEGRTKIQILNGVGLCDFSTYVHYNESHDKYLLDLSKNREIYAIENKSAVVLKDNRLKFIGKVHLFKNNEKLAL